ncbi:MAG: PEP-CTERM sorting domain-containing protein [Kiritimatiellia bacterium]
MERGADLRGECGSSGFKFYTSNDGGKWFGNGSTISLPATDTATLSDVGGNSNFNQESGKYYTFTAKDSSSLKVALQVTAAAPVGIGTFSSEAANAAKFDPSMGSGAASGVRNNVNTVNLSLAVAPGSDEKVYVAYSTDNFASNFNVVQATGSGSSYTADIPAVAGGTTVNYYTLTSTWTSGSSLISGVSDQGDLLLKALKESASSKLSYTTYNLGNGFHLLNQTAGTSGERMLEGSTGASTRYFAGTETEARIYSGNVWQGASTVTRDQSAYVLHYKIGFGGTWNSLSGSFSNTSGNDKYWVANLSLTGLQSGRDIVYYYLEQTFTNSEKTFIHAESLNEPAPQVTGNEERAQINPFFFVYGVSAVPEPASASLVAMGLLTFWLRRRSIRRG